MKSHLMRLFSLLLALLLSLSCAIAEETGESSESDIIENLTTYPENLFAIGDTLFVYAWNELYKTVEGGWQRIDIYDRELGSFSASAATEDGIYLLAQRQETYNEATDSWELPDGSRFTMSRLPVDENGVVGELEPVCEIAWDVREDSWPQFYGMQIIDGTACILLHDDDANWELNTLYRVDLATGKGAKVTQDYVTELVAYKDGLLLSRRFNWEEAYDSKTGQLVKQPEVVSINPTTGEVTALAALNDTNCAALVYDPETDSVYFAGTSFVYRFDNTFASAQTVGYLIGSSTSRSNSAATLYRDCYYISEWQVDSRVTSATIDPALLPTRTLRLADAWMVDDILRDYAKAHPDVAIEYIDSPNRSAEDFRSHMQSPQAADIYNLSLPYSPYAPLLKYGLLADLSASETVMNTVGRMYPHMTDAFLKDGKLYGLPVYISASTMGYYPDALEKVGLTAEDLPTTYDGLMDFLTDWYYDYYDDYEEMQIFEWSQDLHAVLFNMIFTDQVLYCESRGEAVSFRTPTIQKLLTRLDSPEMKTVFDALVPKMDDSDSGFVFIDTFENNALFSNYADVMPVNYQMWMPAEALPLKLDENTDPVIQASMNLLTINKASSNQDLALEVLAYIAERLPQHIQTALLPDVNDPIEASYYEENLASYREAKALLEKQMAEVPEEERADYEETLAWYDERIQQLETEERWVFTADDIASYRERIAPYLVVSPSSIFTDADNPASTALQLYLDGARDADWLISEIDRVVRMMQLENQ